jgi:hypothetical protein
VCLLLWNQSQSVFHILLVMVECVALPDVKWWQEKLWMCYVMSHFPLSEDNRRNPPVMASCNSSTTPLPPLFRPASGIYKMSNVNTCHLPKKHLVSVTVSVLCLRTSKIHYKFKDNFSKNIVLSPTFHVLAKAYWIIPLSGWFDLVGQFLEHFELCIWRINHVRAVV